jgi:hypothetical protein
MTASFDPDLYRSASLDNALANLTGPLASGAAASVVTADESGRIVVDWSVRRPLLLASLATPLNTETLTLMATVDPDGAATALPPLAFESYSESGAALVLYAPDTSAGKDSIPGFTLALTAERQPEFGAAIALPVAEWTKLFNFKLVEGNAGKLLYVMLQEKARLRRQSREVCAMRMLGGARRDALDRIGAGLGVVRFQDDITYDVGKKEIVTVVLKNGDGEPMLESDEDYARRLGLYQPFMLASRSRFLEVLNGTGKQGDPNQGALAGLGLNARFTATEQDNPFALAFRIIGIGGTAERDNFLAYLANDFLIWLPDTAEANAAHDVRYLPQSQRDVITALRQRLRDRYAFPASTKVAPRLADALDRLAGVLKALGFAGQLTIERAQDGTAGSRYEFGLGIDLTALTAADLDDIVSRVNDAGRAATADDQAEQIIAAARALPPETSATDPDGAWLFQACGIVTVHRLSPTTLYLSHLPVNGLLVDGPLSVAAGAAASYSAHFYPPEDPAINAALSTGIATAAAAWALQGQPAWTQLSAADETAAWANLAPQAVNAPPLEIFAAAGLPAIADPTTIVAQLKQLPGEMIATLKLDPALAGPIIAGAPAAIAPLSQFVAGLRAAAISSAIPFVTTANDVIVVVAVQGLPQIGVNLSDRRSSGFRWYVVSLGGSAMVTPLGSATTVSAGQNGVVALVCMGYVRQGFADPYEVNVDLPDGTLLSLKQYEFLMNALELLYPIGVNIGTYAIRQSHVDLDGDGTADPLKPAIFRTYRSFRKRRLRGVYQDQ